MQSFAQEGLLERNVLLCPLDCRLALITSLVAVVQAQNNVRVFGFFLVSDPGLDNTSAVIPSQGQYQSNVALEAELCGETALLEVVL